jgi:phage terminase large subunit-like protein
MITTPSGIILPPGIQSAEVSSLGALNHGMRVELLHILDEIQRRSQMRQLESMFPDGGPFARNLYTRHLEFFACGTHYSQRVFMAANRVGKTMGAGTEWTYHLTGEYPHWWTGYRFNRPIRLLVSGDTHETTRDILQLKLLGSTTDRPEMFGTGLIPGRCIKSITARRGNVQGAVERALIRRKGGGESELWFRSYEQGRQIFQGFELDGFWPDEECPQDVYEEGLVRLMTRKGICTLTFTPLQGLTELVQNLQESEGEEASIKIVQCGWEDVPHLDENEKRKLYAALPPHQRDARTKGIPQLGSGAIYQVSEDEIKVPDFELPAHWPRAYAMDTGWEWTAAVWGALDREAGVVYLYSAYKRGQAEPPVHAQAIQARGSWMRGVGDAAAINAYDGRSFIEIYRGLGLDLELPDKAVEAGIQRVWEAMSAGKFKVFASCGPWFEENDHLMDSSRYLVVSGMDRARTHVKQNKAAWSAPQSGPNAWMS